MTEKERIPRFDVPTLEMLTEYLTPDIERARKVLAILSAKGASADHERTLAACDKVLGTCGVEALGIDVGTHYTDHGIGTCTPFSYCNTGDSYEATLTRDHAAGQWVIACLADLLEEYERENKLGDFEEFEERPEQCPSCNGDALTLKHFPHSGRGPSYSWVCDACNHHCFAPLGYEPTRSNEDTSD